MCCHRAARRHLAKESSMKIFIIILFSGLMLAKENQILYPIITFTYDWRGKGIDTVGNIVFRNLNNGFKTVSTEDVELLQNILPQFIKTWEREAALFFDELYSMFQHGFKQTHRTVVLYLGQSWSYGSSNFLILGMRNYVDIAPWHSIISKDEHFASTMIHELLHIWVDEVVAGQSKLLAKYACEHEHVRDHIHLMAIQKMIYNKLHRQDILEDLDTAYRTRCPVEYCRAWEIVNDIEGHITVIQDIVDRLPSIN